MSARRRARLAPGFARRLSRSTRAALSEQDRITLDVIVALLDYADDTQAAGALDFTVAAFPVSPSSILLVVPSHGRRHRCAAGRCSTSLRLSAGAPLPRPGGGATRIRPGRPVSPRSRTWSTWRSTQIDRFLAASPSPLAIEPPAEWDGADSLARPPRVRARPGRASRVRGAPVAPSSSDVLPTARPDAEAGLVHLPDGLETLPAARAVHTTTDRTPEDLHATGVAVVARIHEEFADPGGRRCSAPPTCGRSSTCCSPIRRCAGPARRRSSTLPRPPSGGPRPCRSTGSADCPEAVCTLEAIPELEAEGPPDRRTTCRRRWTVPDRAPTTRTSASRRSAPRSTSSRSPSTRPCPGITSSSRWRSSFPTCPCIRRLTLFTAYAEGWGLYSERLADEMGLYSSPLQRMGMLSADVWRASRLVVDTGLHAFGWSRQRAIDYMLENTPAPPIDVVSEVDRYIAYPAQALSYMTGRLEIERLRTSAARRARRRASTSGASTTPCSARVPCRCRCSATSSPPGCRRRRPSPAPPDAP